MVTPLIRSATPEDVVSMSSIYGQAVRDSAATLDLVDPPNSYWHDKISNTVAGNHVLVVEDIANILGFAYSDAFRPRPGYAQTRKTSVYLGSAAAGKGLGVLICSELLSHLRADGIHLAVAVLTQPNPASVALHEKLGFTVVGTFHEAGRKFDRWVDTRWYELPLE